MIAQLTGTVVTAGVTSFVIDVQGVGFAASTTPATAAALRPGEQATVHTSLVVREDSMTLYGFSNPEERDAFDLVQSASGVGPRLALAMVSVLAPDELAQAISTGDVKRLSSVPGIGAKSAQKLVIELKDKVLTLRATAPTAAPVASTGQEEWREQVTEGLLGLGWSAKDATRALEAVEPLVAERPDAPLGTLMRAALSSLARS